MKLSTVGRVAPTRGTRLQKLLVVAAASAVALSVATAMQSKADTASYAWAGGLPGCHTSQPALAHFSPTGFVDPQPAGGPVPCGVSTGYPTNENRIEVTNNGTVIYMPALLPATDPAVAGGCGHAPGLCTGNTVARSVDGGVSWTTSTANAHPEGHTFTGDVDNNLYMDHASGRLFYYDYDSGTVGAQPHICGNGEGATIFFSDDNGATWNHGSDLDHSCSENPTVLVGKSILKDATWDGGVVYLCGNNFGTGIGGAGSTGKACSKSLDGGSTWVGDQLQGDGSQGAYSGRAKDDAAPYAECAGASSSAGNDVQPLSDGTLVVVVPCNGKTYLAQSLDEGRNWSIRNEIPSGGSLRVDNHDNLYKLNGTLLSASHNGVKWTAEHDMVRPGLKSRGTTFFAQGLRATHHQPGRVAVMYYGTLAGHTTADGFITETRNAFDDQPMFWTGQVNEGRPLLTNGPGVNIGITVLDFIGGAYSTDRRSVWASFAQDCGDNLVTDPNCSRRLPGTNPADPQDGFAGRLVWSPDTTDG